MTGIFSEQWLIKNFAPVDYIPAVVFLTIYESSQMRVESQFFQDLSIKLKVEKAIRKSKKSLN